MAKVSNDYIEWVVSLNATQLQGEYHKLEKDNKELQHSLCAIFGTGDASPGLCGTIVPRICEMGTPCGRK